MARLTRTLAAIADEVKALHDQDEALSKQRVKTKVEQRDVRLKIGSLCTGLADADVAVVAARSGYTVARLRDFSFVRKQWPVGTYPADATYTALEELARDADRFTKVKSGMSKRDARAAKGGKVDTPSRWSPEVKAKFIAEALQDPDVARAAASDVTTRAAFASADNALYREHRAQRDLDPSNKALRQGVETDDVVRQLTNARYLIARALDTAMDDGLHQSKRAQVSAALGELATHVSWFQAYLDNGDTSFEQALEDLLRSQENN